MYVGMCLNRYACITYRMLHMSIHICMYMFLCQFCLLVGINARVSSVIVDIVDIKYLLRCI